MTPQGKNKLCAGVFQQRGFLPDWPMCRNLNNNWQPRSSCPDICLQQHLALQKNNKKGLREKILTQTRETLCTVCQTVNFSPVKQSNQKYRHGYCVVLMSTPIPKPYCKILVFGLVKSSNSGRVFLIHGVPNCSSFADQIFHATEGGPRPLHVNSSLPGSKLSP